MFRSWTRLHEARFLFAFSFLIFSDACVCKNNMLGFRADTKRVSLFLLERVSCFFLFFCFEREGFAFFSALISLLLCVYRSRCSVVYRTALKTEIVCLGSIR